MYRTTMFLTVHIHRMVGKLQLLNRTWTVLDLH